MDISFVGFVFVYGYGYCSKKKWISVIIIAKKSENKPEVFYYFFETAETPVHNVLKS